MFIYRKIKQEVIYLIDSESSTDFLFIELVWSDTICLCFWIICER